METHFVLRLLVQKLVFDKGLVWLGLAWFGLEFVFGMRGGTRGLIYRSLDVSDSVLRWEKLINSCSAVCGRFVVVGDVGVNEYRYPKAWIRIPQFMSSNQLGREAKKK